MMLYFLMKTRKNSYLNISGEVVVGVNVHAVEDFEAIKVENELHEILGKIVSHPRDPASACKRIYISSFSAICSFQNVIFLSFLMK